MSQESEGNDHEAFRGLAGCSGVPMRIPARNLAVGDILRVNDWRLHVIKIEREHAMAVLTAEFAFLIHFGHDDIVTVHARADAA
jgi:hypothetical protein